MNVERSRFESYPDPEKFVPRANYAQLEYFLEEAQQRELKLQEEIAWLGRDQLTGLKVDKLIRNELDQRVEKASKTGDKFVLIIGDVDNMKYANTEFGHYYGGDALLKAVGRSCREEDLIGRAGGDEIWWIADLKPRKEYRPHRLLHARKTVPEEVALSLAVVFEKRANAEIKKLGLGLEVGFSAGFAVYQSGDTTGMMIDKASSSMLERKAINKELRGSMDRHPTNFRPEQK